MTLAIRGLPDRLRPVVQAERVRPAYAAGIRAAIATVAPLLVGELLHDPSLTWASLGGFNVALADRGGAYRTRAATQGVLTILAAGAAAAGVLVAPHDWLAVPLVLLIAGGGSFARVLGNAAATVGAVVATTFVVSLAFPGEGAEAAEAAQRAKLVGVGGAWAMALALVLWPLRPYRPARLAVAECYRRLAVFAAHLAGGGRESAVALTHGEVTHDDRARIRQALEEARVTLASMRRGRPGETGRGERLLLLLELAEQCFVCVLAVADVLDAAATSPHTPADAERVAIRRALGGFSGTARDLARRIESERPEPPAPVTWDERAVLAALERRFGAGRREDGLADAALDAQVEHAASVLRTLRAHAAVADATVATLEDERPVSTPALAAASRAVVEEPPPPVLATLRAGLARESVALRHALRVGIVTAAAAAFTSALGLPRGYWVTLTALLILQPYSGATWIRAVQRVSGTVLGGLIAVGVGAAVREPLGILAVVFVLAAACVALMPINYAAFSMFLTPTFVLLAEVNAGDWHLSHVRILNTLIGGALALAGARLLWPSAGREYMVAQMADALDALREYLRVAVVAPVSPEAEANDSAVAAARRRVGLAVLNAESAFQWLLAESRGGETRVEAAMTILTYVRRLGAAITALASAVSADPSRARQLVEQLADRADAVLYDLARALRSGGGGFPAAAEGAPASAEVPAAAEAESDPLVAAQVGRVWRNLAMLRSAVPRLDGSPMAAAEGTERLAFR